MSNKILCKTSDSCIAISDGKMYILSSKYKDYSPKAITIIPGFQVELGRPILDIKIALKETRLPIIIQEVSSANGISHYQIIRMRTGKVDDKIVATVLCKDGIVFTISFNKNLVVDREYRRYNNLSLYHQIVLPHELSASNVSFRRDQVMNMLKTLIPYVEYNEVEVIESGKKLEVNIKDEDIKMKLLFISNPKRNNNFELLSISAL